MLKGHSIQNPLHRHSEKACICFKMRRTSTCDYTVFNWFEKKGYRTYFMQSSTKLKVESDENHFVKSWDYKNSIATLKRLWIQCVIPFYAPTKAPYFCFMLYLNFQRHLFCLALYLNYHILLISLRLGLALQIKELYAFILIFRLQ